jgi:deoxyribodipyrimidine photo-lyase
MIVGSFLVKHLLIHWHQGETWFWDTLFDADLANNSASWQWIAGCGADAAPYFRIFNPILQSQKFDPDGDYIRKYIPELSKLDNKQIHTPWEVPPLILKEAGITLGKDYPEPIVNHGKARDRALEAFQSTKVE